MSLRSPRMFLTALSACAAVGACTAGPAAARIHLDQLDLVTAHEFGHSPVAVFATAHTAKVATKASSDFPVITSVAPLKLGVGDKLTIHGRRFVPGKGKDTVVFQHIGSAAVFVRAANASTTKLTVVVPKKLVPFMTGSSKGAAKPTKFRLRILARRFSLSFTRSTQSPLIGPAATTPAGQQNNPPPGTPTTPGPNAPTPCPTLAKNNPTGDQDSDGMLNYLEIKYGTDPCKADTDGDGLPDGYEYYSAIDLNGSAYPYPATLPWPNPLDPTDANDDFDGDGLSQTQEYQLWVYLHGTYPLNMYSDGTQNTGGSIPVTNPQLATLDNDGDGNLTDDEIGRAHV